MTQRNELVLPLHGGPPIAAAKTRALQTQVNRAIEAIIARGQLDGTVTALVTAGEIVTFGAMLDSPTRRTRARFAAHDDGN